MRHERPDPVPDPVDVALEQLRADDRLELPDAELERRLLARAASGGGASSRHRLRIAAAILLGLTLAGAAVGAAVGLDQLKRWWYAITVDGTTVSETVDGNGERHHEFTARSGVRVTVHVRRNVRDDRGVETSIAVTEQGPQRRTEQEVETVTGGGRPVVERVGTEVLASGEPLHVWTDSRGQISTLFLAPDPNGAGSLLLVQRQGDPSDRPLVVLARIPRDLGPSARVDVLETESGGITVRLDDGHGWVLEIANGPGPGGEAPEVVTPDGQVRVKVR